MAKKKVKLTDSEAKELKDLIAKKKANKLSDSEAARLAELNEKCGFTPKRKSEAGFKPGNDFSWWNKIPELLSDAANYKCNYIAGQTIAGTDIPYIVPGVARIVLQSVYGNNVTATDAINVWARDLYLRMFQKYRPASGYSAADLGITLLAAIEIVKLIAKYERVYGVINRYSVLNTNMPLLEAQALGLTVSDVDYLQSHLSDFRYDLNFLIRKAQRLCVPKDISALNDAISLFGYEYLDHENARAQIIIYDIDEYGLYNETILQSGGCIYYNPIDSSMPLFDFNADNMCNVLDLCLQALIGSDSVQRIFADLVVWFGADAMLQFVPVPEDYVVIPVVSESMLHKMHNLETFNTANFGLVSWADPGLSSADISNITNGYHWVYQCGDRIVTKCGVKYNGTGTNTSSLVDGGTIIANNGAPVLPCTTNAHVLDTYRVDATSETVTEGVLLKNHARVNQNTDGWVTMLDSCAFYIVRRIEMHSNSSVTPTYIQSTDNTSAGAKSSAGMLAILDWAPLTYYATLSGVTVIPTEVYGDVDSIIPIYGNGIAKLQRTILLSGIHTDVTPKA